MSVKSKSNLYLKIPLYSLLLLITLTKSIYYLVKNPYNPPINHFH